MKYDVLIAETPEGFSDQYAGEGSILASNANEDDLMDLLNLTRRFGFSLQITPIIDASGEGDEDDGNG